MVCHDSANSWKVPAFSSHFQRVDGEEGNQDHELLIGFWCTTYDSAYNWQLSVQLMIQRTTCDSAYNLWFSAAPSRDWFVYTSVLAYNLLFPVQLGFWRTTRVLAYNLQLRTFLHSYSQFPSAPSSSRWLWPRHFPHSGNRTFQKFKFLVPKLSSIPTCYRLNLLDIKISNQSLDGFCILVLEGNPTSLTFLIPHSGLRALRIFVASHYWYRCRFWNKATFFCLELFLFPIAFLF